MARQRRHIQELIAISACLVALGVTNHTEIGIGRNGRAVQQVLADHPRFVRHRVVQRDGADVAPVAIQVALPAGGAGPAELQQPGGGLRRDVVEMDLDLGDLQLGFLGEPRIGCAVGLRGGGRGDRLGGVEHRGPRDVGRGGQFAELLLVQRVVGRAFGQRMAEAAIARAQ